MMSAYDTGDKAIQCGRHNDVFKLWLMWKSKGMEGYRQQINRLMDLAAYFTQRIRETDGYELVVDPPEFLNICFWYVPSNLRGLDPAEKKARLEKGLLFQCNQMSADYLFMQDKPYDVSYDTGDKAIQCGRHNDVFKLWLMWKSKPEFLNICFWYVPSNLRGLDPAEKKARLEKIAPKIKARMMERGTTMVGYQPDKQRPNFFRMIISSQAITRDDLEFLIQEIIDIGESL
ncbi:hypothetical protein OSTOST_05191 [Ostertagia ostertagi]